MKRQRNHRGLAINLPMLFREKECRWSGLSHLVERGRGMATPVAEPEQGSLCTPHRLDKTGVSRGLLEDLALKILYLRGDTSLIRLSEYLCLSLGVVEEIFQHFRQERLCEVKGMVGGTHRIVASGEGRER